MHAIFLSVEHVYKIYKKLIVRVFYFGRNFFYGVWSVEVLLRVMFILRRSPQGDIFVNASLGKQKAHRVSMFLLIALTTIFLYTDLSVAGLPAELKHITQRRKRKQP